MISLTQLNPLLKSLWAKVPFKKTLPVVGSIIGVIALILVISASVKSCQINHNIAQSQADQTKTVSVEIKAKTTYDSLVKAVSVRTKKTSALTKRHKALQGRLQPIQDTISSAVVSLPTQDKIKVQNAVNDLVLLEHQSDSLLDTLTNDTTDLQKANRTLNLALIQVTHDDSTYHAKYERAELSLKETQRHEIEVGSACLGVGLVGGLVLVILLVH